MPKEHPDWRVVVPVKISSQEGAKPIWTPVGVGFNNSDKGKGMSISLRINLLSPEGEYVLFPNPKESEVPV